MITLRKAKPPLDYLGQPIDPSRRYLCVDAHTSGTHDVATLTANLGGDHEMGLRNPALWFDATGLSDREIARIRNSHRDTIAA